MFKRLFSNKYIYIFARFVLGFVFIIASVDKITIPEVFAQNVEAYKLIPFSFVNIIALVLPWLELIAGLFIISGVYIRASTLILISLLALFIISMTITLFRGLQIDCGCFGSSHDTPVSWKRIFEDVILILLGIYIFVFAKYFNVHHNIVRQLPNNQESLQSQ